MGPATMATPAVSLSTTLVSWLSKVASYTGSLLEKSKTSWQLWRTDSSRKSSSKSSSLTFAVTVCDCCQSALRIVTMTGDALVAVWPSIFRLQLRSGRIDTLTSAGGPTLFESLGLGCE